MKKLDALSPIYEVTHGSKPDLEPAHRLIVLVPEFEADTALAARKIREVAKNLESRVMLLGLSSDAIHEPATRRRLIALLALLEDPTLYVETAVEIGSNWFNAVQPYWHPGDVLVCFSGQTSPKNGLALHEVLSTNLHAPVYVLSDIPLRTPKENPPWVSSFLAWGGSLCLIAAFFTLQVKLVHSAGAFQTFTLYTSLAFEGGLIWFWNNLFN